MMDKQSYFALNPWWEGKDFKVGIWRQSYLDKLLRNFERKQIEILVGSRRVGKTTLLKQIIKKLLGKGVKKENIFYISCDYAKAIGIPLFDHLNYFRQIFGHKREKKVYLFLDEVQESPEWQVQLKTLYDNENLKIVCSGSTSALIKAHGGKLTGRQISTIVYPLDFQEFLNFRGVKPSYSEGYLLESQVEEFLNIGGYPENVLSPSQDYLSSLLEDIFLRDILRNYPVKNLGLMKDLFKLLASSLGSRVSFHKLAKVLGASLDTVKDYVDYLENVFLVRKLNKWTTSYSEKTYSQKKIYLNDNGFKTLLTGSQDLGAKAENAAFWHLSKEFEIGYFAESAREVDFIAGDFAAPLPVEVKYTTQKNELEENLGGLKLFLTRYPKVKKAKMVTQNIESKIRYQNTCIEVVPLWQFLLKKVG